MAPDVYQPGTSLTLVHARRELEAGLQALAGGQESMDLAGVREVDSSAVALLLAWQRAAATRGRPLMIANLPENLRSLADLYGVSDQLSR